MKKGQITLLIILGIIIVAVISIGVHYRQAIVEKAGEIGIVPTMTLPLETQQIQDSITGCVEATGGLGLLWLGFQGGYSEAPENSLEYFGMKVPYFYFKGKSYVPTIKVMEDELEAYVEANLEDCITEFEGFQVSSRKPTAKAKIETKKVKLEVDWPISIQKGDQKTRISDFEIEYKIRLGELHDVAEQIVKQQQKDKENLCLSCLVEIGFEKSLYIEAIKHNNDLIYRINDNSSRIGEEPYIFMFGSKF